MYTIVAGLHGHVFITAFDLKSLNMSTDRTKYNNMASLIKVKKTRKGWPNYS